MEKIAICVSGGAFKFSFLLGATYRILQNHKDDVKIIAGISSGAIVSFLLAVKGHTYSPKHLTQLVSTKNVFGEKLGSLKYYIEMLYNLLRNKSYLLSHEKHLSNLIRQHISYEEFDAWSRSEKSIDAVVTYVKIHSRSSVPKEITISLKSLSYNSAIKAVCASCSIPPLMEPILMDGEHCVDGGLLSHNPCEFIAKENKVEKIYAIYSFPHTILSDWQYNAKGFALWSIFRRIISVLAFQTSISDAEITREICIKNNIKLKEIYPDKILTDKFFLDDTLKFNEWYDLGEKIAMNSINSGKIVL